MKPFRRKIKKPCPICDSPIEIVILGSTKKDGTIHRAIWEGYNCLICGKLQPPVEIPKDEILKVEQKTKNKEMDTKEKVYYVKYTQLAPGEEIPWLWIKWNVKWDQATIIDLTRAIGSELQDDFRFSHETYIRQNRLEDFDAVVAQFADLGTPFNDVDDETIAELDKLFTPNR